MKRFVFALLALSAACGIAQPADTVPPQGLSQQQAVETARRHFLEDPVPGNPPDLRSYRAIELDPKTWGERYWAFRFTTESNTIYYVNKQSGFVQAVGDFKIMPGSVLTNSCVVSSRTDFPEHDISYWNVTLRKRSLDDEFLITVSLNAIAPTTTPCSLRFDIREGHDHPHPKYYYPETKFIGRVKDIHIVRTARFKIKKRDLEKYEYICAIVCGPHSGCMRSFKIGDIPDE